MKKLIIILASLISLNSFAQFDPFKINKEPETKIKTENLRWKALKEHALTKGIADGRKYQFEQIQIYLEKQKRVLDTIYQVDHLYTQPRKKQTKKIWNGTERSSMEDDAMYNGFLIQPPIIIESNDMVQISDNGLKKEKTTKRYLIAANSQFVTAPLHWQSFLVSVDDLNMNTIPDDPLLQPRDESEQAMMISFYKVGFEEGKAQTNAEVETRVKTLTTMVTGMTSGRILIDKNILQEPEVVTQYIPTAGNKTQLTLDTSSATIINNAEFILDPNKYKTIIHQANPLEKK